MNKDLLNIIEAAKEFNLYVRIVTGVKTFDSYNSFFNIFDQYEEACRRIVVLTPYEDLEEVYDENPDKDISEIIFKDGNLWVKSFPLLVNPNNINLNEITVSKSAIEAILKNSKE